MGKSNKKRNSKYVCDCQDSDGVVCGKVMSKKEYNQDGMCSACADNVWEEMNSSDDNFYWKHKQ